MDLSTWVLIVVIGWTVLGLLLVAVIWTRSPWKAVLAWLGLALLPLGIWLVGLSQAAVDGWNTLALWWQSLVFTIPVVIGLSMLGLGLVLLLVSRLVPSRPRVRKDKPTTELGSRPVPPAGSSSSMGTTTGPTYRQPPQNIPPSAG
ncbi:MAG TPA: hypothetical protein VM429_05575 [Micropruina sp.]|nr:hypothetical protein [Micropruina sp.]